MRMYRLKFVAIVIGITGIIVLGVFFPFLVPYINISAALMVAGYAFSKFWEHKGRLRAAWGNLEDEKRICIGLGMGFTAAVALQR